MARRVLPGFGLSLGFTLLYSGLILLLPLTALVLQLAQMSWAQYWQGGPGPPGGAHHGDHRAAGGCRL